MSSVILRPLETVYRGHRFRSRTEARWAVTLDALGARWDYEPVGWEINGQNYLPDFWIGGVGWLEIKGNPPSTEERDLCRLLSIGTEAPVYLAFRGIRDNLECLDGTMFRFSPDGSIGTGYRFGELDGKVFVEKADGEPPSELIKSAYTIGSARRMWDPIR